MRTRLAALGILTAYATLSLQNVGITIAIPLGIRELGTAVDLGPTYAVFLAGNILGMVAGGALSRRWDISRTVLVATVISTCGLVVAAWAPVLLVLVGFRGVQGVGAGLSLVAVYIVAVRLFHGAARARMLGVLSTAWILPGILGPSLVGAIADEVGWRWTFVIAALAHVPGGVAVWLSARQLSSEPAAVPARSPLLPASAVAAGIVGLALGETGPGPQLGLVAVSVLLIVVATPAMLPPGTLTGRRGVPAAIAMRGLLAGAFFGVEAWLPLMLIDRYGLSVRDAGLIVGTGGVAWLCGVAIQARSVAGTAQRRVEVVGLGASLITLGMAGMVAAILLSGWWWPVGLFWSVACMGMGSAIPTVSALVYDFSAPSSHASNTAALQSSDALGCALVASVCGWAFARASAGGAEHSYSVVFVVAGLVGLAALCVVGRLPRSVSSDEQSASR
ncbi:MFS transporter [Nocardioides agariphilus]|uniref:MFS transporter n=1 Tax=Nocardioides agariphilus TaxID=433664 RepID=A0A930VPD3_9ACTN|nr:MFS transporter [Nocardioides agariphilus]MBF4769366.1 MFS transporter [Nocardioides agariphilus]